MNELASTGTHTKMRVVVVVLLILVCVLGALQYMSHRREAQLYDTIATLQSQLRAANETNRLQQEQISALEKQSLSQVLEGAGDSVAEGVEQAFKALDAQLDAIDKEALPKALEEAGNNLAEGLSEILQTFDSQLDALRKNPDE